MTSFGFDLETTSANSATCYPVQIALVLDTGEPVKRVLMNTLVRPGELIDPEAAAIHHITDEMVFGAPDYAMVAWQVGLLTETLKPDFVVGFNSKYFDALILDRCLGCSVFGDTQHIDVLDVAYRFFPTLPGHKLGMLYEHFMGFPLTGAHDASVDVIGTLDLLKAMRVQIGMTMEQLYTDMLTPRPYSIMPIGKHKGKELSQVDPGWARWMKNNATGMRPDLQVTVDYLLGQ